MDGSGLRVGVAGWFLQFPYRGVGRYSRLVIEQLAAAQGVEPVVLLAEAEDRARLPAQVARRAVRVPQPVRGLKARLAPKTYEIAQRIYWEQVGINLAWPRLRLDVLYSPYHTLPVWAPKRSIVTIHDLIPYTEPAYRGSRLGRAYFALLAATARRASAVIAVSEWTRRAVVHVLGIPEERVHVVPNGVEPEFNPRVDAAAMAWARARLGLPARYLLYVGGSDVRKNIGVLLEAAGALRGKMGNGHGASVPPLVIAAPEEMGGTSALQPDWRAQARAFGLGGEIHWVDRIAEEDLPAVYRGAMAFLFPSRAEGFGLTPLEAMACGTPVLCADSSSLPEVVGEAGLLLPPDDPGAWAAALLQVCTDAGLRGRLRAAGPERAAQFTWERTGQGVLEVIRGVACG